MTHAVTPSSAQHTRYRELRALPHKHLQLLMALLMMQQSVLRSTSVRLLARAACSRAVRCMAGVACWCTSDMPTRRSRSDAWPIRLLLQLLVQRRPDLA